MAKTEVADRDVYTRKRMIIPIHVQLNEWVFTPTKRWFSIKRQVSNSESSADAFSINGDADFKASCI